MPPIEVSLVTVLDELFTASTERGAGVHQRLSSGLHVKVGVQGQRRMVIAWRDGDRLPSASECGVVGDAAGFYAPKYHSWTCKESQSAFLITDGFRGQVCQHAWGMRTHFDAARESGHASVCTRCRATWRHTVARRGSKESWHYNGQPVREAVFHRRLFEGPVPQEAAPSDPITQPLSGFDARLRATAQAAVPPTPLPRPLEQQTATDKARQAAQELALAQHLRGLLTCISFRSACRSAWFARHQAIEARRTFLNGATLPQLREECRGRHFASHMPRAVPYVLLALRWRHIARALPLIASPARRARTPRRRKGEGVAA